MGEVYRATDTKLGRDIALKVLPAEMAQDPERLGRFRREAKALAQLDHPNIVTIHSVEECGGIHFLTMQLVEGLPLDRLIPEDGLPVEQIVEIATALGDALAAAHEKGIVHRDLKPANVMVSNDGRVKVLDFGLAKDIRAANLSDATMTSDSRTQVGVVMGTPAYMSPEQTSGRALDHRTDIFSMGVLIHEMATGRRPFEGSSSAELVSAILRDTPQSVTDLRPDLPSDLARIVRRCLEKDPRYRLQTARDVSNEFRDLSRQSSQKMSAARTSVSRVAAASDSAGTRADEGFWVAVLPFKYSGGNADLTALAEGLTEDIVTGLSRFSYLRVIARNSTTRYANESFEVRSAGKELGARYVMEGTLRQAGTKLRLAVQLVDATSGAHLWAETYVNTFDPEAIFELQEELVPRIVATIADTRGVLPHSMSEALRGKPPDQLTPYEALLRSFAYFQRIAPEEHAMARAALERAVEQAPGHADAWAILSILYREEYTQGYNLLPEPLERAFAAAQRAIEIAPSNHYGYHALASVMFLRGDRQTFKSVAERALILNPMDGFTLAYMGIVFAYSGDWERGCALAEKARGLNPHHPGWYWFPVLLDSYRKGDYRNALDIASRVNMPGFWRTEVALAAIYVALGELGQARSAVRRLLAIRPGFASIARAELEKWWEPELVEQLLSGLRQAGLEMVPEKKLAPSTGNLTQPFTKTDSGTSCSDEGFWVAVLPFKYAGASAELKALADGLSEEIVTGLSRFSYLRVIARGSTAKYSSESGDIRAIGKELGARYVMEGSLRLAGSKLRLAVQLVDATTGTHLWAETYERAVQPESVFELQDDLVPRIVATVADRHGVLAHSMSEAVRARNPTQLTPYEAVLLSFGYAERLTPDEQAAAKACLERSVAQAPGNADAWAMLAMVFCDEYSIGLKPHFSLMDQGLEAAKRAIKAGPSNHMAYNNLAYVHFLRREFGPCRHAAERALALNPMDGSNVWFVGLMLAYMGEWDRGCALTERAMELNPHYPGKYRYPLVFNLYRKGDYKGALSEALRLNMPDLFYTPLIVAAAAGQLREEEIAAKAVRDLRALRPDMAVDVRENLGKWFQPEFVEHVVEGLVKAGLEIPPAQGSTVQPASLATSRLIKKRESGATRADEGFCVAVLPFREASSDADLEALADGLSEDVTAGLSRFPYLQVIAHNSAMAYKGRAADVRTVGRELGARYVIEGSIRKRGRAVRVSAQLMDAVTGTQLWAEAYDREIGEAGTFQVQDDLTDHIVTTVADGYGVLVRSMAAPTRDRKVEELSASELVLRHYAFMQQVDPQEHAVLRAGFERALEREPNHAAAWACLSNLYQLEYFDRFNPREKPLERARDAAWRAVKIDPACQMGWKELAAVHFFSRDFTAFRETAERAMSLNPRDGTTLAWMSIMIAFSGDWERGVALTQRAIELNRHHPGWYHNVAFHHHYRKGEYEAALQAAKRINMPEFHWMHLMTAAACGMVGRHEEARTAIESLRKYTPTFLDLENVREDLRLWDPDKDDVERLLQGLLKAGLKYGSENSAPDSTVIKIEPKLKSDPTAAATSASIATATASGASRAAVREDEGFWVAVLPFKNAGTSVELKALADGLSEEIVTGLSRFSYLRVIARGSTAKYSSESGDVRAVGKELGARYVMEGSLRQAGSKLRLAVQLVDTVSGAHLWAETYDRAFAPEAVFEVQDDLVPRIVSTVADQYGVLPRSMSEALRSKSEDLLTPHEAVLRAFSYFTRITPEEHAMVRRILEHSVREAPDHADSWAMLSMIYRGEFAQGYNAGRNPLDRALAAAQRAVDLAATNALGHYALATVNFFRKEMVAFRVEAEKSLTLNPLDAGARAYLGLLTATSGDWDRGCEMVESSMHLNPNCPGYFYFARCCNGYRQGKYEEVLEAAVRVNMPNYYHTQAMRAAALGQLGRQEEARKALQSLLALRPDFAAAARQEYAKWYDAELIEQLIDGLRKAGLEIGGEPSPTPAKPANVVAPSSESKTPSIAVLPFANMSADKDQEYFSDGLAEEIINLLAKIPGLKVIARTSAFAFRSKEQDIRGIADALGVTHVLEGSVRRAENRLRITAQLVDAADGTHLWSERYDRELRDIFAVQDEISAAIAGALRVKLSGGAETKRYEPKITAYDAYLKGKYHQATVTPESLELAKRCFEQAIQLDPAFGLARIGVGFYWLAITIFGRCPAREAVMAARAEADRALQVDPSLPDAHALLGCLAAIYDLDWAEADRLFDFPMAKQVGTTITRPLYGWFQYLRGNVAEAVALAQRAIEENPLDVWARMNLHAYLQAAGRERDSLEQLNKVLELDGNQVVAMVSKAMILADQGNLAEALATARRAYSVGTWLPETAGVFAGLLRRNGDDAESQSIAKTIGRGKALGDARTQSIFHLLCGEVDEGADWAEKAINEHDLSMRMIYLRFVVCKELRASHRWPKIAQALNLPQA
jgi:TolB-like protein/Tfp pilus assembly protein PilF